MDLGDVWQWYCEERLGALSADARPVPVTPWQGVELMFGWRDQLHVRWAEISRVPYSTTFDQEADGALCLLARDDTFATWDRLSLGGWRVIAERWLYATTVMLANEAAGNSVIAHLPSGLDRQSQVRALGLMFLLGGARTIDRRLQPQEPDGSLPPLPASLSLRRQ